MIIQVKVDGEWRTYPLVDLHSFTSELSLTQLMAFNRELAVTNISAARSMADVLAITREVAGLSKAKLMDHPEGMFLLAVLVWGARIKAGEKVGLLEAADFAPLTDLRFVPEPSDLRDGEPEGKDIRGSAGPGNRKQRRKK